MVAIINIGGDLQGECLYEVRINKELITTFKHNRLNGLNVCLQKASKAVQKYEYGDIIQFLDEIRAFNQALKATGKKTPSP